jgi:hypothetical protein
MDSSSLLIKGYKVGKVWLTYFLNYMCIHTLVPFFLTFEKGSSSFAFFIGQRLMTYNWSDITSLDRGD